MIYILEWRGYILRFDAEARKFIDPPIDVSFMEWEIPIAMSILTPIWPKGALGVHLLCEKYHMRCLNSPRFKAGPNPDEFVPDEG